MKATIIIPVYNSESTIKKCIDSVLNQTYSNIEIIAINDGSTDSSLKILKELSQNDSRLVVIDKKNSGVSSSRNMGINNATGDYIAFLDSDDWYEPTFIDEMLKIATEKKVDVVRCNYIKEYSDKSIKAKLYDLKNKYLNKNDIYKSTVFNHFLYNIDEIPNYVMLLLIKSDILKKNIKFDEDLYMLEDVVFYQKLFNNIKNIYFYDCCLYHYNSMNESTTRSVSNVERNIFGIMNSEKRISDYLNNNNIVFSEKKQNECQLNLITKYIQKINYNDKNNIKELLKKIYTDNNFKNIILNYSSSNSNIYKKIIFKLMKKRNINIIVSLIKIRQLVKRK